MIAAHQDPTTAALNDNMCVALLGMAETFRLSNPPRVRLAIKCLQVLNLFRLFTVVNCVNVFHSFRTCSLFAGNVSYSNDSPDDNCCSLPSWQIVASLHEEYRVGQDQLGKSGAYYDFEDFRFRIMILYIYSTITRSRCKGSKRYEYMWLACWPKYICK
jgi:hypothetical protein